MTMKYFGRAKMCKKTQSSSSSSSFTDDTFPEFSSVDSVLASQDPLGPQNPTTLPETNSEFSPET